MLTGDRTAVALTAADAACPDDCGASAGMVHPAATHNPRILIGAKDSLFIIGHLPSIRTPASPFRSSWLATFVSRRFPNRARISPLETLGVCHSQGDFLERPGQIRSEIFLP